MKILLYSLGVWIILSIIAIFNGLFRELIINSYLGGFIGHIISTLIFICAILFVTYFYFLIY